MALLWSLLIVDPLIVLSTILCGTVSQIVSIFDSSARAQIKVARAWATSLLWIAGVQVEVQGLENIRGVQQCVFTCNHLSYMDTPVMLRYIPLQFFFLAKSGLFKIPFLGWHLSRAGHIPVPMDDARAAVKTLVRSAGLVTSRGVSVLIFPEGGRSHDGELQEFKDGAAYIAIKAQVPIVPVALVGTREILAMHSAEFRRGRVILRFGQPISTEGITMRQRSELSEKVRGQISAMLLLQSPEAN